MKHHKIKYRLLLTIIFAVCQALYSNKLQAHDVFVDGIYYNLNTTEKTASVTFNGRQAPSSAITTYADTVTVPETFTYQDIEYTVTEIGDNAFTCCWKLTGLVLPGSIRTIGSYAFEYTYSLKKLELPEGVTSIAYRSFFSSYIEEIILPSTLCTIGDEAFMFNKNLKELNIPAATTGILFGYSSGNGYNNPFGYNDSLRAINVDAGNPKFSSKDGVLYNKEQTTVYAFPGGISDKFFMPSTITKIDYGAFSASKATVFFGPGIKLQEIEAFAFSGSKGKFYFYNLPKFDKYVWSGMAEAIVYVPADQVASVKKYSEGEVYPLPVGSPYLANVAPYIKGLSLSLDENPFYIQPHGVTDEIEKVEIIDSPDITAQYDPVTQTYMFVGLQPSTQYTIRLTTKREKTVECKATTNPANVKQPGIASYMAGMHFGTIQADSDETAVIKKTGVVVKGTSYGGGSAHYQIETYFLNNDTLICDFYANTDYTISPFVVYEGEDETKIYGSDIETSTKDISMHNVSHVISTQRTLKYKQSSVYKTDETVNVEEAGIVLNSHYVPFDEQSTVVFTGLNYNTKYTVYSYIRYNGGKIRRLYASDNYTLDVTPKIKVIQTATSLSVVPDTCSAGDAGLLSWNLYCNDEDLGQDSLYLTGLSPQQSINILLRFNLYGNKTKTATFYPKTLPIEFNMLTPKCVSPTSAIVAAETNTDPNETNVGFQWKKYDAPETLEPKEAYTILEEGRIEGVINNLQSTSYYNVRAFYQADDGSRHYGQWVTFDPSDYSYFEPTVRTYEAIEVGSNSAKVKAYVLSGTDDIIEQGFEYWPSVASKRKAVSVNSAPSTGSNVSTVLGTGQVMIVTLTDLQPNCAYTFRSFVKTASGTTYGEERSLITESDPTGIGNVEYGVPSTAITGYYDLEGRKYNEPQKGLNIIRYSDGSARKIMVK